MGHGGGMRTKKRKPAGANVDAYRGAVGAMNALDAPIEALEAWARGRFEVSEADWMALQDIILQLRAAQYQQFAAVVKPANAAIEKTTSLQQERAVKSRLFLTKELLWAAVKAHADKEWAASKDPSVDWKAKVAAQVRAKGSGMAAMRWSTLKDWLPKWGITEDDIVQYLKSWKPN